MVLTPSFLISCCFFVTDEIRVGININPGSTVGRWPVNSRLEDFQNWISGKTYGANDFLKLDDLARNVRSNQDVLKFDTILMDR